MIVYPCYVGLGWYNKLLNNLKLADRDNMTRKDYIKTADLLSRKLLAVETWHNIEAYSLALAFVEDFINLFSEDNPRFDRNKFVAYIDKKNKEGGSKGTLLI